MHIAGGGIQFIAHRFFHGIQHQLAHFFIFFLGCHRLGIIAVEGRIYRQAALAGIFSCISMETQHDERTAVFGNLAAFQIGVEHVLHFSGHHHRGTLANQFIPQLFSDFHHHDAFLAHGNFALGHTAGAGGKSLQTGADGLPHHLAVLLMAGVHTHNKAGQASLRLLGCFANLIGLADSCFLLHHFLAGADFHRRQRPGIGDGQGNFSFVHAVFIGKYVARTAFLLVSELQQHKIRAFSPEGIGKAIHRFRQHQILHLGIGFSFRNGITGTLFQFHAGSADGAVFDIFNRQLHIAALTGPGQKNFAAENAVFTVNHHFAAGVRSCIFHNGKLGIIQRKGIVYLAFSGFQFHLHGSRCTAHHHQHHCHRQYKQFPVHSCHTFNLKLHKVYHNTAFFAIARNSQICYNFLTIPV